METLFGKCWLGCDNVSERCREYKTHMLEEHFDPLHKTFNKVDLEDIGGVMDAESTVDCFTRMGGNQYGTQANARILPSPSVMGQAREGLLSILVNDPTQGPLPFIKENNFSKFAGDVNDLPIQDVSIYFRNDADGEKYFACGVFPNQDAKRIADALYKEDAMRHILCTDSAPRLEICQFGTSARMEYQVIPAAHPLSELMSQGLQYDSRYSLLYTMRSRHTISIGGEPVTVHLIWQKSARHKKYEDEVAGEDPLPEYEWADKHNIQLPPRGIYQKDGEDALLRQRVKLRAFAVFESPTLENGAVVCMFGHDDPQGFMTGMGKWNFSLTGGTASGGVPQRVEHMLTRLCDVVQAQTQINQMRGGPQESRQ